MRWCLRFGPSDRDVEELLAGRGVEVDHASAYRWVGRFTPLPAGAVRPCRHRVGGCWMVDQTDAGVAGRWRDADRAVDQFGQAVDVSASSRRDAGSARRLVGQAIGTTQVTPGGVVTDRAPASVVVLGDLLPAAWRRTDRNANDGLGRTTAG